MPEAKAKNENIPLAPDGKRYTYETLALATNAELEEVMRKGIKPDMKELVGWEFKGFNSLKLTKILGFQKFKKGFYQKNVDQPIEDGIDGYNVKVEQNNLGEEWIDVMTKKGESFKHGWFDVYPVDLKEPDNYYPNALLLNYDSKTNPTLDPSRVLRDYLVQVYPDNKDLYLGKAYVALGPIRFCVSYFVLERNNKSALTSKK